VADDGLEFGFELETPLSHEQTIWEAEGIRYTITQEPEALLEIALNRVPSAAAGIGWAIGNLHLELSAEPTRLLTPDDPATRQLLDRIAVPFVATTAVFRPGRFARGGAVVPSAQELGASHRH
jgi:urease accessory protein